MSKLSAMHGVWGAVAIGAFVLGSQVFPSRTQVADSEEAGGTSSAKSVRSDGGGSGSRGVRAEGSGRSERKAGKVGGRVGSVVLTEDEIRALGERIRNANGPIDRRFAFSQLLEGLTAENALLMREQIADLPADTAEFKEFHYAWGAIAGKGAVAHGANTPKPDMAAALAGWASADSSAAIRWFESLNDQPGPEIAKLLGEGRSFAESHMRNMLSVGLIKGMSDSEPTAAAEFVMELAAAGNGKASWMMGIVTDKVIRSGGLAEAADWAAELPSGPTRANALTTVARDYAGRDPEAAVAWLESIPSTADKSKGLESAFSVWAAKETMAAGEYINKMGPSAERDWAISGYAPRLAAADPQSAVEWADAVSDPGLRERALIKTGYVYYHRGNKAAAKAWLPTSGLSPEAQAKVVQVRKR